MAVGLGGTILSSNTGLSWSQTSLEVQYFFYNITYGNGMFIAVGEDVAQYGIFAFYKGTSWEIGHLPEFPLYGVAIGNSTIVLLGERGSIFRKNEVLNPLLDPEWLVISEGTAGYLNAVLPCYNQLIAAGYQINMISPNGVIWKPSIITSVNYWSIASNGPNCVVVGDGGTILTTLDGNAWFSSNLGTSTFLFAVTSRGQWKICGHGVVRQGLIPLRMGRPGKTIPWEQLMWSPASLTETISSSPSAWGRGIDLPGWGRLEFYPIGCQAKSERHRLR